ncbi:hypothetical protein BcepSauron_317 [Burkholderia phage BcepSauron]|uniref:Uncharacterized protein n=1 Tax=Burkholderia phage BcepSauron TaxID=2530033 RepID=A0A482MKZ0_9CAUD|nr:hypothetical protein H1O17_gp317 [Burkholderia phage BcepSauron]QBQ74697.1 hypothetical protein BcepSauron_317 [Burkholderia phage BcepSauron]
MDPMPIFPIPPVPGHAIPLMVFDWMGADPAFAADVRMAVATREARIQFTVPRMDPDMERMIQDEYTEHLRRTLSK